MKDADRIVQLSNGPLYYYGTAGYLEWREHEYRGDGFDLYWFEQLPPRRRLVYDETTEGIRARWELWP